MLRALARSKSHAFLSDEERAQLFKTAEQMAASLCKYRPGVSEYSREAEKSYVFLAVAEKIQEFCPDRTSLGISQTLSGQFCAFVSKRAKGARAEFLREGRGNAVRTSRRANIAVKNIRAAFQKDLEYQSLKEIAEGYIEKKNLGSRRKEIETLLEGGGSGSPLSRQSRSQEAKRLLV